MSVNNYEYYLVECDEGVVNDSIVHVKGSIIEAAKVDPDRLSALIKGGSLAPHGMPVTATDTGKTPAKDPHPEQAEQTLTKVIEPTVRKGGRR